MTSQLISQAVATARAPARLNLRDSYDLLLVSSLAVLLPASVLAATPLPALAALLGLAAVVLAPGYALTAAVFVRRDDLDGIERAALSFGLSIVAAPLLALVLDRLPWGIRPVTMATATSAWLLVGCAVAGWRRHRLGHWGQPYVPPQPVGPGWRRVATGTRSFRAIAAGGLVVGALLWGGALWLAPALTPRLTEFYALGAAGRAEHYPRSAAPGEAVNLLVGVINREGAPGQYRIEVRVRERAITEVDWFTLDDSATLELPLSYTLNQTGDDQRVDILLFFGGRPEPYRRLQLWLSGASGKSAVE